MNELDLTYSGKLKLQFNILEDKKVDVLYTICGDTGKVTTTSFKLIDKPMLMITFDYQELKKLVEGANND